jgi:pyocin large subunit-like protein
MDVSGHDAHHTTEYEGKPYDGTRDAQADFRDDKGNNTLPDHFDRHGEGFASEADYKAAAVQFLEKPPTPTTQTFVSDEGTYFRYDTATNEFGIINKYGGISTYFEPPRRIDYWADQIAGYAPRKGR